MDPVSHAIFGGIWAQAGARGGQQRVALAAGGIAALAPDLDVLIRSSEDTLLEIEYHRHFTHALSFVPIGAMAVALVLWPLFRRWTGFGRLYLYCFLGYLSHPFLDAVTSYGTYLMLPFSDRRSAWNVISVIDPLFTLPLIGLVVWGWWGRRRLAFVLAAAWAICYLGFGVVQQYRAESELAEWAQEQGIGIERKVAKPGFANLILWRGLVDDGEDLYVVAIRNLPATPTRLWEGPRVSRFDPATFPAGTRLGDDLRRFDHFSSHWLFRYPPYEDESTWFAGDLRYAIDPASSRPLWGVRFEPEDPDGRAEYVTPREVVDDERAEFFLRLRGGNVE